MFDNYATYTNVDYEHTGAIHIVGLSDDDYMLADVAVDHRAALRKAENCCGDYFQVRLCYPGQTIVFKNEAFWDADDEAEKLALAYLTEKWEADVREWAEYCGRGFVQAVEEQAERVAA